jgi:hypothetical protein
MHPWRCARRTSRAVCGLGGTRVTLVRLHCSLGEGSVLVKQHCWQQQHNITNHNCQTCLLLLVTMAASNIIGSDVQVLDHPEGFPCESIRLQSHTCLLAQKSGQQGNHCQSCASNKFAFLLSQLPPIAIDRIDHQTPCPLQFSELIWRPPASTLQDRPRMT